MSNISILHNLVDSTKYVYKMYKTEYNKFLIEQIIIAFFSYVNNVHIVRNMTDDDDKFVLEVYEYTISKGYDKHKIIGPLIDSYEMLLE